MKSIRFLPLDIPKFEYKQKVLDEFKPDTDFYFWSEEYVSNWQSTRLLHNPEGMKNKHIELQEFISAYMPFKSITLLKLFRANMDVKPHVDESYTKDKGPTNWKVISEEYRNHQLETEPCGYRMIIAGDRQSLYLSDGELEIVDDKFLYGEVTEKTYCEIPEATDSFALKSYGSMHGVDRTPGDDNRLLAFIIGWIDIDKHNKLIEQSEEVYKNYVHYA